MAKAKLTTTLSFTNANLAYYVATTLAGWKRASVYWTNTVPSRVITTATKARINTLLMSINQEELEVEPPGKTARDSFWRSHTNIKTGKYKEGLR